MSNVDQIHNAVLLFSNPTWNSDVSVPATTVRNVSSITPSLAYSETLSDNITTISSKYAETDNGVIQGFLYVPEIQTTDYCYNWTQANIPHNVTHRTDLPPTDLRRIAIAPWVDIECTQDYLTAARNEGIRALVFYRPGGDNSKPRPGNDIIWALDDSFLWKEENHFPVYAVSSLIGEEIIYHLSQYSGAVSDAPNGTSISAVYHPNTGDYIRIWTEITVSTDSDLPRVWVFVLIILAIISGVILMTSGGMHAIHYRRRKALRRRVQSGKVDLEALGIKKIPIPRWAIKDQKLWPILKYSPFEENSPPPPPSPLSSAFSTTTGMSREAQRAAYPIDHQPRCEICTRHFIKMTTWIKEAPCGHIFHPDCIDEYTLKSSLCPLCKTCLLPKAWSPNISNAMVRRERSIRKCREVIEVDPDADDDSRARRPSQVLSSSPSSTSSSGEITSVTLQTINRVPSDGRRHMPRFSQPRQLWSRTSSIRRTPPLNYLPTVSETDGHLPPLPPSPASSQMPISETPDTVTNTTRRPSPQPSPLPLPPQPAVLRHSGDRVVTIDPSMHDHPATELERVRPSPSSSTRRRRIRQFLGPDLDDELPQHPVVRVFRKVFPGL